jgi:hypothetical protein
MASQVTTSLEEHVRPGFATGLFSPDLVVQVKTFACELAAEYDRPMSRCSTTDLVQHVQQNGSVASINGTTLWC